MLVALVTLAGACSSPSGEAGRGPAGDTSRGAEARASTEAHAGTSTEAHAGTSTEAHASPPETATAAAAGTNGAPQPAPAAGPRWTCTRQTFTPVLPLAEASGAALVPGTDGDVLLVVGDSGTRGQYLELDPGDGKVLASGRLPLGRGASDDLEGLSVRGDTVYAITSAGWMRHWRRHPERAGARRYQLLRGPYPVAANGARSEHGPLVCDAQGVNCGRNYEGLCLRDAGDAGAGCAGFAVSKQDGVLYCLTLQAKGELRMDAARSIAVAAAETLTGCHFAPARAEEDLVWVGSNAFGGNRVFTVSGWQAPAQARVDTVGVLGMGFGEAIAAAPGGVVYRFSDTASDRSLADKYHCE